MTNSKKEIAREDKNIYQRISSVIDDVLYIEKEDKKVNNQYRFISHDAVTKKTTKAFLDHGVYAKPKIISHDVKTIEVSRYDKYNKVNKVETSFVATVEVEYEFININKPDDIISGIIGVGQGIDSQDKAYGKAISYACKYALLKGLGIETGDDPEQDVEYNITKQKLAKCAEEDSKAIFEAEAVKDFANIKKELENCNDEECLKSVWLKWKKEIANFKKWDSKRYELLEQCKDAMKDEFEDGLSIQ